MTLLLWLPLAVGVGYGIHRTFTYGNKVAASNAITTIYQRVKPSLKKSGIIMLLTFCLTYLTLPGVSNLSYFVSGGKGVEGDFAGMEAVWSLRSPLLPDFNPATRKFEFPASHACSGGSAWIDIGGNVWALTPDAGNMLHHYPVLAFEPLAGFYSKLTSQGSCVYPFPMAVSEVNGFSTFHKSVNGHSSSLLDTRAGAEKDGLYAFNEVKSDKAFPVMTVRLDDIIPRLPFPRVAFLKVDAQGYDLASVKSGGDFIRTVDRVQMESAAENAKGYYEGQPSRQEIVDYMVSMGFEFEKEMLACCDDPENPQELNLYFLNTDHTTTIPRVFGDKLVVGK